MTYMTFATLSIFMSSKSEDLYFLQAFIVIIASSSSTGLRNKICSILPPELSYTEICSSGLMLSFAKLGPTFVIFF